MSITFRAYWKHVFLKHNDKFSGSVCDERLFDQNCATSA